MNTSPENKTKKSNVAIGLVIVLLSFLVSTTGISMFLLYKDTIHTGVNIENIDVGGLAINEAREKIKTYFDDKSLGGKIKFIYGERIWDLDSSEIDFTYDYTKALNEAQGIGREGNYYERLSIILKLYKKPENIELVPIYNSEKLETYLYRMEKEINKAPQNATIKRENGRFVITDEILGLKLNTKKAKEDLNANISKIKQNHDALVELSVETESPKVTSEMLSYIDQLLGTYSTTFNSSNVSRTRNISLAAQSVNGMVLMPGEVFSFNEVVGPRSKDRGYQNAPVILNGELVDDLGGGICQVSSTIYNAVLLSDVQVVERIKHSIPSTYVPKGRDATVSYGVLDFKFSNNYSKPIFIESSVQGNKMITNIYGYKTNDRVVKINSFEDEVVKRPVEIKYDKNMLQGQERIEEEGRDGYKVSTYKIVVENGKEISRERISYDYYKPKTRVIVKGTKKPPEKIEEPVETDIGEDDEENELEEEE